jgi:hypothetical protein
MRLPPQGSGVVLMSQVVRDVPMKLSEITADVPFTGISGGYTPLGEPVVVTALPS